MEFSISPYYDDFESENGARVNNYTKILFKPGYAVQARELTQMQSILQNQIKSLGDFVLENGSPVHGGSLTFDNTGKAIQLQTDQDGIPITLSDFNNQLIINSIGAVVKKAKVIAVDDSLESSSSAGALIIKYYSGEEFESGDEIKIATGTQETATLLSANAISNCSTVSIQDGIFYVDGYFVYVPAQTIVIDSTSTSPNAKVGLQVEDSIVNYSQDTSLLDPAQSSFNYQAPGADRYQLTLTLTKRTLDSLDTTKFFELLRIENGLITKQVKYPQLGELESTLARRTNDQSGDFTVKPFKISLVEDQSNTEQYLIKVDPGKAYVKGYEFETIGTVTIANPKARTQDRSEGYRMAMEYGNYVLTSNVYSGNVSGFFDMSNFGEVDLHIVPTANINTNTTIAYTNTRIGTARIRDMESFSTGEYYTYLLDVNTTPVVMNAVSFTLDQNTANIGFVTGYANAYTNVTISILAGNSAGEVRTITSYDVTTGIVTVDAPFPQQIDTNSKLALNFGVKDVESIVVRPSLPVTANVFGGRERANSRYACMDISPKGKDVTGNTRLYLTEYNKLLYPLPQGYIAQSTVSVPSMNNISYISKKNYTSVAFTSSGNFANTIIGSGGSHAIDVNEVFSYGYTNSFVPDNIVNADIIITVRDKQSSNLTNGSIIVFNRGTITNGNGVYQTDENQITLAVSASSGFVGDVTVTVSQTVAETVKRTKTRYGGNTSLLITDSPDNGTSIIGSSSTKLDAANGILWITNSDDVVKVAGVPQSLYVSDVIRINGIYDSGDPTTAPFASANLKNISYQYLFNTGQKDNYYDHAYILLKEGYAPPKGQTAILFSYYNHSATPGLFNADSYPALDYSTGTIPVYTSKTFGSFRLSDSVDLRPTRANGITSSVSTFSLLGSSTGLKLAHPNYAMELSYGYYLPRIDKLVLTKKKQFKVLQGIASGYPKPPIDTEESMTLYVIAMPAYSADIGQIKLSYIENRGYTMKDIGSIDKRVRNIEYYTALNDLQKRAKDQTVFYQNGAIAKDIYGILTDNFDDFSVADNGGTRDVICKIGGGSLEPYKLINTFDFKYDSSIGTHSQNGRTFTVSYTETPCVVQNTVTRGIIVQPFSFGQFKGDLKIVPETDYWFSETLKPVIIGPPKQTLVTTSPPPPPPPPIPPNNPPNPPPPSGPTITLSPTSLTDGSTGSSYSVSISATGGTGPYTFTVVSGSLPSGLSLSSGGVLSGTPTVGTTTGIVVKATDSNGDTGTRSYQLTIAASTPSITVSPTTVSSETAYSAANTTNFSAFGGTSPYTYSITSGAVPTGMTLTSGGVLSGTPTQVISSHFTVTATDSYGYPGSVDISLDVKAPAISLSPSTISAATGGVSYTATLTASGGSGSYSYALVSGSGSLPTGLSLTTVSNQGKITGTPSGTSGTYTFTVRATDTATYQTVDRIYALALNSPSIVVSGALPSGTQGSAYSSSVSASGGTSPYTYAVTSGSLPTGLSLTTSGGSAGAITGTPSSSGTYTFTITATDAGSFTGSKSFTVKIAVSVPTITLSPTSLSGFVAGSAYAGATITASGGTASYTYAVTAGSLPPGISISSGGAVSGTPNMEIGNKSYTFTVTATDANGYTGSRAYTVTIGAAVITLATTSLPSGTAETGYYTTLSASGGTSPYTYYVYSGTLPPGLRMGNDGIISGTCNQSDTWSFTIQVVDANGYTGTGSLTIVMAAPVITVSGASSLFTIQGGSTLISGYSSSNYPSYWPLTYYELVFSASGGIAPYDFAITGNIPPGLQFTATGGGTSSLSGTTTTISGNYQFTVTATDTYGFSGQVTYGMSVTGAVVVNPPPPPPPPPPPAGTTTDVVNTVTICAPLTSSLDASGAGGACVDVPIDSFVSSGTIDTGTVVGTDTTNVTNTDVSGSTVPVDQSSGNPIPLDSGSSDPLAGMSEADIQAALNNGWAF